MQDKFFGNNPFLSIMLILPLAILLILFSSMLEKISNNIDNGFMKWLFFLVLVVGLQHSPVLAQESRQEENKEWAYSLALQAATWGSPLVTMYLLRYHDAVGPKAKSAPNTIWKMEDISTPTLSKEAGYVTPNVNVIYGFGFMDLRQGPVLLEVPDSNNRYYMVEIVDMWTNAFAYVGGKATGYKGGKFVLVGPAWKGDIPAGMIQIACPTPWVLLQPRVHIYKEGQVDLAGARKILEGIQVKGVSLQADNYPMPELVNRDLPVSALDFKDPLQFWEILSLAMQENPPPADQIAALLPLFEPLGLKLGKLWQKSELRPEVIEAMQEAAQKIGTLLAHLNFGHTYHGAFIPPPTIGNPGTDYKTRAVVARVGLTANTPEESVYWMYSLDHEGNPLTGSKNYRVTFKEAIPFDEPGFWSLTLYGSDNNYTVTNPINRYMLGSDTRDLKKNADGSFTIYIQHKSPGKDKESNWLPSPPGNFYLVPRAYAPKPVIIRLLTDPEAWPIPDLILQ